MSEKRDFDEPFIYGNLNIGNEQLDMLKEAFRDNVYGVFSFLVSSGALPTHVGKTLMYSVCAFMAEEILQSCVETEAERHTIRQQVIEDVADSFVKDGDGPTIQ